MIFISYYYFTAFFPDFFDTGDRCPDVLGRSMLPVGDFEFGEKLAPLLLAAKDDAAAHVLLLDS